jgi:broad specificity phosphatase PhoE
MKRCFLVRHGATDWNAEGRIQGQSDPPLNQAGQRQAGRLGKRLESVPFTGAWSSDMRRAAETAAAVLKGRSLQLQGNPELREKNFGAWEGLNFREVEVRYPNLYRNRLMAGDPSFAPPGGESDLQLYARAGVVADRMRETCAGQAGNLLVVSHGGMLRALIACLLGLRVQKMWGFRFANAGLSVVSFFDDGGVVLDLLNDTSHLGDDFGE